MTRDLSQAAAYCEAAIDAVHQNEERVEADSARHRPSALLNARAWNHDDPSAGHA
jgi:hypothetical protein